MILKEVIIINDIKSKLEIDKLIQQAIFSNLKRSIVQVTIIFTSFVAGITITKLFL